MALREYLCNNCDYVFEEFVTTSNPEEYRVAPCRCGATAKVLPALIGGYTGNMGGASVRPKNSTAMPKAKVFTGNKPDGEQLELPLNHKESK